MDHRLNGESEKSEELNRRSKVLNDLCHQGPIAQSHISLVSLELQVESTTRKHTVFYDCHQLSVTSPEVSQCW